MATFLPPRAAEFFSGAIATKFPRGNFGLAIFPAYIGRPPPPGSDLRFLLSRRTSKSQNFVA